MDKEVGNRIFTPKLRDIQNLPRCQTPNFFNFDTMRTPTHKMMGTVGMFDSNGDFYFNDDRELHRIQQYFSLFYHNRVEHFRQSKTLDVFKSGLTAHTIDGAQKGGFYLLYLLKSFV